MSSTQSISATAMSMPSTNMRSSGARDTMSTSTRNESSALRASRMASRGRTQTVAGGARSGKRDGPRGENSDGRWGGPVGENVAKAIELGYSPKVEPYHGYYFKVLKGQGPAAPLGKMDFV